MRILLVDDDIDMRVVIGRLIRQLWKGVELELANGGREALQMMHGGPYDVVLTDVQMPDMDGYEIAAAIRHMAAPHCHTKIICMTGGRLAPEKIQQNGIDGHLLKPFSLDQLRLKISEVVAVQLRTGQDV